jgi:type II secretory pathway pseudopilin PulG
MELLIVISIIAVLLAMLLPAARSVREAARRTQCINNVRQQVLAILNYESAHQHLPPATGMVGANQELPETTERYSGLLSYFGFLGRYGGPYIEEYDNGGKRFPAYPDVDDLGYPLWTRQQSFFVCPALAMNNSDDEFAITHYALVIGDVARNVHQTEVARGAFAVGLTQKLEDITDGMSHTLAIAEIGGVGDRDVGRHFAINQPEELLNKPSQTSELVTSWNRYKSHVSLSRKTRGGNWADGTGGPGLVNTILPPGSASVLVGGDSEVDGFFSASINHSDGTVVGYCDGSTYFLHEAVDVGDQDAPAQSAIELKGVESKYGVWGALGSANGNEKRFDKF